MSAVDEVETIGVKAGPEAAAPGEAADASPPDDRTVPVRRAMLNTLSRLAFDLSLLPVAALVLAGQFGGKDWLLDMTNFFRPHIAAVALVLLLLALLASSMPRLVVAALVVGTAVYPLLVASVPAAANASAGNLRVTTANLNGRNRDEEGFRRMVEAEAPDILVVEESNWRWRPVVESLPGLPHVAGADRSSVMVASRYPVTAEWLDLGPAANPTDDVGGSGALRAVVERPGARPLVVYGVHAPTTRKVSGWVMRNAYLRAVAERVKAEPAGTDVLVVGDWNTPYWSPVLRSFMNRSGLVTTERGAWPPPTRFFREFRAPPALGTPIDRIAVPGRIGVAAINVSKDFGSDHLAVTADLAIP